MLGPVRFLFLGSLLLALGALAGCLGTCIDHLNITSAGACSLALNGRALRGSRRQSEHLLVLRLDLVGLVVADNHCVVCVAPRDRSLIHLQATAFKIGDVDALVVLLVVRLEDDLLLLVVHLNHVVVFRVGQVSNAPLKPLTRVLSDEDGVCI